MNDRLYRSVDDRVIAGVCGGLADRFNLDPALVRIGYVVLAIVTAFIPFLILYVVMAAVVPEEPTWSGVRPVGPAPWDTGWGAGGPAAGAAPGPGPAAPAPGDDAPAGSTMPPGLPVAPDAVPGWTPPGGTAPAAWTAASQAYDPNDRHARRAAGRAARWDERAARRAARREDPTTAILVGIFLVGLGVFFLLRSAFDLDWNLIWPAILVTLGVIVVIAGLRPRRGDGG